MNTFAFNNTYLYRFIYFIEKETSPGLLIFNDSISNFISIKLVIKNVIELVKNKKYSKNKMKNNTEFTI